MFFQFVWFRELKKAKVMVIILSAIVAGLLFFGIKTSVAEHKIKQNYTRVEAVVSDNAYDNGATATEFEFSVDETLYHVQMDSIYYTKGTNVHLLYQSDDPTKLVLAKSIGIFPKIYLGIAGFFAVFDIIYIINYAILKRKQKKAPL